MPVPWAICWLKLSPTLLSSFLFSLKPPSLSGHVHAHHICVPRAFYHLLLHTIVCNTYNIVHMWYIHVVYNTYNYMYLFTSICPLLVPRFSFFLPFLMRWAGALVTIFIKMISSLLIKEWIAPTVIRRTMPPWRDKLHPYPRHTRSFSSVWQHRAELYAQGIKGLSAAQLLLVQRTLLDAIWNCGLNWRPRTNRNTPPLQEAFTVSRKESKVIWHRRNQEMWSTLAEDSPESSLDVTQI